MIRSREQLSEPTPDNSLTPEQAADVLRYLDHTYNAEARENGWKDKISIGQTAVRASQPRHSLLPPKEGTMPRALLNPVEAAAGLAYIQEEMQKKLAEAEPTTTDEEDDKIAEEVDKNGTSYYIERGKFLQNR